jgi:hypothetical protein
MANRLYLYAYSFYHFIFWYFAADFGLLDRVLCNMSHDSGSNKFFSDHSPCRCHSSVADLLLMRLSINVTQKERTMTQHTSYARCGNSEVLLQIKKIHFYPAHFHDKIFRCMHFCGEKTQQISFAAVLKLVFFFPSSSILKLFAPNFRKYWLNFNRLHCVISFQEHADRNYGGRK